MRCACDPICTEESDHQLSEQTVLKSMLTRRFEDELLSQTTTDENSLFNETDRIVKSLLEQTSHAASGCVHGRMVVLRVYENDENLSLQKIMRSALETLRLYDKAKDRRVFSVISDIGTTHLYEHLETSAIAADLRRPDRDGIYLLNDQGIAVEETITLTSKYEETKRKLINQGRAEKDAELRYAANATAARTAVITFRPCSH